ncbi:trans-sulfuration enzyme family protein [Methylophaga sp. OBS4]|uniref:trans-sulfuration enzyme family protein n=1 Tax=Methylophaga sp. OBS4 TaxID=2991935 RepID=UPI002252ED66|nr:aminotransferase class I/II-fold pyridoxal phosphate-dependent enzyme [Methylophaga sp. OBS4]MCX4187065.1 aminotransferase class I/II-fold pyridoxal phosphate-dependent enzyme [Methylophaga sp. OBS4]
MTDSRQQMTLAVHAGNGHDTLGSPFTPLYDTTTFRFDNTASLLSVINGEKPGAFYTRYGMNPTIKSLEQRLAALDEAEAALAFSSGMAAISSLFLAHGGGGIICLGEIYGGTAELLQNQLTGIGVNSLFLPADDHSALEQALRQGASLVFFETPANPTLQVIDIQAVAGKVHQYPAKVAVDNTFASPVNQKPLQLGADFSVQSATKFLGGHSDLTAGVLTGSADELTKVNGWRKNLGQMIAPEIAHKLKRSLITLPLRIERHNFNTLQIARFLQAHPSVETVFYPGLETDPGHPLACRQMQGFGGMLSFNVKGGTVAATTVIDNLNLIALAPSLGGAETLATQPVTTSHHGMAPEQLQQAGISGAMIRLSVGLESVDDLINDLQQALQLIAD